MTIKYGKCEKICVAFDEYTNISSTKGEEHARRAVVVSANVTIYEIMPVIAEREEFLRNTVKKVQFKDSISMILKGKKSMLLKAWNYNTNRNNM